MGPAQVHALRRLRPVQIRNSSRHARGHLRPLHGAPRRDAPVTPHLPSGHRKYSRWSHHGARRKSPEAAGRRGLPRHRSPKGHPRLLHRQRRLHPAVSHPHPPAVIHQSPGARQNDSRSLGHRRGRHHRHTRHRPRRGGSLAMSPTLHSIVAFVQAWWVELLCAVLIVLVVPLIAGYIVLVERKVMADMQARLGPMRVGPHGLLQPIADALKLLIKEDLIPDNADQFIFWLAPVLSMTAALTTMGASPSARGFRLPATSTSAFSSSLVSAPWAPWASSSAAGLPTITIPSSARFAALHSSSVTKPPPALLSSVAFSSPAL